jgi:hypothetical protein
MENRRVLFHRGVSPVDYRFTAHLVVGARRLTAEVFGKVVPCLAKLTRSCLNTYSTNWLKPSEPDGQSVYIACSAASTA